MIDTPDQVLKAAEHLRSTVYSVMHQRIREDIDLIEGNIPGGQPEGEPAHIPSDALKQMRKALNQTYTKHTSFVVTPIEKKKEKELAEKLIADLFPWVTADNDRRNQGSCARELGWDINLGVGFLKGPFFDASLLADGQCPIVYSPTDNRSVFPDPAGRFVIEISERYQSEIEEELRLWNEMARKKGARKAPYATGWINDKAAGFGDDYQLIEWVEFYSPAKRCFCVKGKGRADGVPVSMQNNILGYIPYSWSYSRLGRGRTTGKPEDRCISRLYGMKSSIEAKAQNYTALHNYLRYNVWPIRYGDLEYKEFFASQFVPKRPGQIGFAPAAALDSLKDLGTGQVNPDLYAYIRLSDLDIEGIGGNDALLGQGSGEESGLKQAYRIRQAAIDYAGPIEALEAIYSDMFTKVCRLLKNEIVVKEILRLPGDKKINGSEISERIQVNYKQEFKDPSEDSLRIELGLRLAERNHVTEEEFQRDYRKTPDWATFMERYMAEKILKESPQVQLANVIELLKRTGHDDVVAMILGQQPGAGVTRPMIEGPGGKQTVPPEGRRATMESPAGMTSTDIRGMPNMEGMVAR